MTIIHPIKFFHALVMPFQILGYSFDRNPDVECLKTEHLIIRRGMAGVMHIDGDAESESTEITVEILKNSLQVVCNTRDI